MRSFRSKPVGWRYESARHGLAARGVSSRSGVVRGVQPGHHRFAQLALEQERRAYLATRVRLPQYQLKQIEAERGKEVAEDARRMAVSQGLTARQLAERYDVRYVRKMKNEPVPERAFVRNTAAVERLRGPERGSVGAAVDLPSSVIYENLVGREGRRVGRDRVAAIDDRLGSLSKRVAELNKDVSAAGAQTLGQQEYLKKQLSIAEHERDVLIGERAAVRAAMESGEVSSLVSPGRLGELEDRSLESRRVAAREDALAVPVVVLPVETVESWRRPGVLQGRGGVLGEGGGSQTRLSKYFVRRVL